METQINTLLDQFESGRLTRRELIAKLGILSAFVSAQTMAQSAEKSSPTFEATELNHIALRVKDVKSSRDFYKKHLGLRVIRETDTNCFMSCGDNFIALFQGDPRMDHYCYSVKDYAVMRAAEKLKAAGIQPDVRSNRIYFPDPDGLIVQLAAQTHRP